MPDQPRRPSAREETSCPQQTEAHAAAFARTVGPGTVVLISGEVGAGKTTWVRGACRALGVTGAITSPTFTIGRRYAGQLPISHLDLYRLERLDALDEELVLGYLDPAGVCFIEWAEHVPLSIAESSKVVRVCLRHLGHDRRMVELC